MKFGVNLEPAVGVAVVFVANAIRFFFFSVAVASTIVPVTVMHSCLTIRRCGWYTCGKMPASHGAWGEGGGDGCGGGGGVPAGVRVTYLA